MSLIYPELHGFWLKLWTGEPEDNPDERNRYDQPGDADRDKSALGKKWPCTQAADARRKEHQRIIDALHTGAFFSLKRICQQG